ncbi:MAG: hypothetical protein ACTSP1_17800 [Candidatus Freyarchaeota archaeon]
MPEIYCLNLGRKVDGGYCAFICELPETEKRIVYNPFRGIFTRCSFSCELQEAEPFRNYSLTPTKTPETKHLEKFDSEIIDRGISKLKAFLEED